MTTALAKVRRWEGVEVLPFKDGATMTQGWCIYARASDGSNLHTFVTISRRVAFEKRHIRGFIREAIPESLRLLKFMMNNLAREVQWPVGWNRY